MWNDETLKVLVKLENYIDLRLPDYKSKLTESGLDIGCVDEAVEIAYNFIRGVYEDIDEYEEYDDEDYDEDSEEDESKLKDAPSISANLEYWERFLNAVFYTIFMAESGVVVLDFSNYSGVQTLLCNELSMCVKGGIHSLKNSVSAVEQSSKAIEYDIFTHLDEEICFEDYQELGVAHDLGLLDSLIFAEPIDSEYNEQVLQDIRNSEESWHACQDLFNYAGHILSCLRVIYENTFSLYPYEGVISFFGDVTTNIKVGNGTKAVVQRRDSLIRTDSTAQFYEASIDSYSNEYKILASKIIDIDSRFGRASTIIQPYVCFNIDDILESEVPLYYPFEAFCYATGSIPRTSDKRIKGGGVQFQSSGCSSWNEYEEKYLKSVIEDLVAKYLYKSFEKHSKDAQDGSKVKFTDEAFVTLYKECGAYTAYSQWFSDCASAVQRDLRRLVETVCTAFVITRNDDGDIFKLKICSFGGVFTKFMTYQLFNDAIFSKGFNVEPRDGFEVPITCFGSMNCSVIEYTYARDITLLDRKPLFGYKAAELFKRQGIKINQLNILIGETEDNSPLFATQGGLVDLSAKICHRFSAGSRSGKGVMTMNILASELANDAALFYIDRKPDMSGELALLSNGRMFCVNGGALGADDVHGCYRNNGFMLEKYNSMPKSAFKHSYLTSVFGSDFGDKWDGDKALGDFVYMKAMIFALSVIDARLLFMKDGNYSDEVRRDFYMDGNVSVVLDEVTNWHGKFEHAVFSTMAKNNPSSCLARYYRESLGANSSNDSSALDLESMTAMLDDGYKEIIAAKEKLYKDAYDEWQSNKSDVKLTKHVDSLRRDLEKAVSDLTKKQAKAGDPNVLLAQLYWTTFFDKYRSISSSVDSLANASKVQSMFTDNNVYMIGQYLNGYANKDVPVVFNKDGTFREQSLPEYKVKYDSNKSDVTRSYMYGFAEILNGCDWFIGRNMSGKTIEAQFGGDSAPEKMKEWLHTRGNWAYIPDGSQEIYRSNLVDSVPKNYVLFKPYLVLNTNDELPSKTSPYNDSTAKEHEQDIYKYVFQSSQRVGYSMWEKIRLDHVKKDINGKRGTVSNPRYGELEDGIGLKGLIVAYKKTMGAEFDNYEFDPSILERSYNMANAICAKFGYADYMDYLLDMSPKGIIGVEDMLLAYTSNLSENELLAKRFPRYANTGRLGFLTGNVSDNSDIGDTAPSVGLAGDLYSAEAMLEGSQFANPAQQSQVFENQSFTETAQSQQSAMSDVASALEEQRRRMQARKEERLRAEEQAREEEQAKAERMDDETIRSFVAMMIEASGLGLTGDYLEKAVDFGVQFFRKRGW